MRRLFKQRWKLAALGLLIAAAGVVYLVWGELGLAALGGGAAGLVLPLLLGNSKPWTAKDQAEHDRRWKWDGSSNDDGLSL